jgi:SAM-dependent methyltransferase
VDVVAVEERFIELFDEEKSLWLETKAARPHGAFATSLHRTLRKFASDYDVDAWLDMHEMFLLGTKAWQQLLGTERIGGALLDIGAGRGDVTAKLAPLFDEVVATETSAPMARKLRARGYRVHSIDLATHELPQPRQFQTVALLNVLDRCARPRTLLEKAITHLAPDGRIILASPLPARPHVDVGGYTVDPDEPFLADGERFEDALASLVHLVLAPLGLAVEAWTRTEYLARGDRDCPRHVLDDVVLVARKDR